VFTRELGGVWCRKAENDGESRLGESRAIHLSRGEVVVLTDTTALKARRACGENDAPGEET
jgi:hypothetical protein